jgi:phenylalanine-4-hydroxylase
MSDILTNAEGTSRNRFRAVPRKEDFTIEQDWRSYSAAEHERWDRLFARSQAVLQDRACVEFLEMASVLKLSESGIPDMQRLSDRLEAMTGWRVVPVAGLVPDEVFFDHLANRRFPAGAFIRSEQEMDYLKEPDVFHDVFGHVPLLANPAFADFMQAYGKGGRRAMQLGRLQNLARLYWYTVEFGLIRTPEGPRIFGAGIMSSVAESVFALESSSPHRVAFDLQRVMRTRYIIDDFQQIYFVIDSFRGLLDECYRDFGPLYEQMATATDVEPHALVEGDTVITQGTLGYFRDRRK